VIKIFPDEGPIVETGYGWENTTTNPKNAKLESN
jgi:hypothetical protein